MCIKVMNTTTIAYSLLSILLISATGCVGTKAGAYRVFNEDLGRLVGVDVNEAYILMLGIL